MNRSRRRIAAVGLLCVIATVLAACNRPPPIEARQSGGGGAIRAPAVPGARTVTVSRGDTLYAIARRNDVAIRSLIEANDLAPPYTLYIDQTLIVPRLPEYVVQPGDTLYRISRCEGVEVAALARLNVIEPPYDLAVGQRLRLPPATAPQDCAGADGERAPVRLARLDEQMAAIAPPADTVLPPGQTGLLPPPPARAAGRFLWPVSGRVISEFGPKPGNRHNDGINIEAAAGTPVRAADNGIVVYVGNELRGYGNLILVRHADNWTTAYAHNAEITVGRGAVVAQGEIIARVGATGNVPTPQSHFELRRGATAVDPSEFLAAPDS